MSQDQSNLPVIFISGGVQDVDRLVEAYDLDPADFVMKAISPKELVARIKWVLRRYSEKG